MPMAKTKEFSSSVDLPIERVHQIVTSEQYLTTTDEMITESTVEILHAERQVGDDGEVRAQVTVTSATPQDSDTPTEEKEHQPEGLLNEDPHEPTGDGDSNGLETTQATIVSAPDADGSFRMISDTPLPNGMGEMSTTFSFVPAGPSETTVNVQAMANVKIPIVGGKLAKKLLESSEQTVENGLERVRRLDQVQS